MGQQSSALKDLYGYASRKINTLQRLYLDDTSQGKQLLAELRHGDMMTPGVDPQLWAVVFDGMPDSLVGRTDEPSRAELAVHATLILYATHQQSQRAGMHRPAVRFGQAVQQLARSRGSEGEFDQGTITRFHQLCAQQSFPMRLRSLRSLVTLMRSEKIVGFDYAQLACDLYLIQNNASVNRVLLRWGRDLHANLRQDATDSTSDSTSTNDNDTTISKEN
ncbi:type I-E CRISPR-associated protein Cse2/CasB [Propionibacterium australiense]|uniref:CRISPR-associated protein Cse2 n=1 Tax=Propionibacterium australiense TaxID=119981 RepID=A0A383S8C3_9ACTN|nr:type I-E CRISPR-associated protein Cse2/CasB [Propionibacterium australiense]RLP07480.1 type I-E CRISPR-associated protein Cse2/CasB [Propionibacterium australiense]SYZ34083.1 CRISPR-associated protein Cse2 [Propionibacterium australiense]